VQLGLLDLGEMPPHKGGPYLGKAHGIGIHPTLVLATTDVVHPCLFLNPKM
jgi:hypothetical protein